jgi:autotransporter adhesin
MGADSQAIGASSLAAGDGAVANAENDIAIGTNAAATGNASGSAVAIGAGNVASGAGAVALGDPSTATGDGAIAQGLNSTATGDGTVAMGHTANAGGGGQGVGVPGVAAQGAVSIGYQTQAVGQGSVALGNGSQANAAGSLAFGDGALANGANSYAAGTGAVATAAGSVAQGQNAQAFGAGAVAIGSGAIAGNAGDPTRVNGVAIGNAAVASAQNSVAVGDTAVANGAQATALGSGAQAGTNATATGRSAIAGNSSVAYGVNANAGLRGTALGQGAVSTAQDSTAVGSFATATAAGGVALGRQASVTVANSVALGMSSLANRGAQAGYTGYGLAAAQTSVGDVSVGSAGAERQITNVAAGSATTDAVNVAQLGAVAKNAADSLGGGAAYDPVTGAYTAPSYVVGGTTFTNVGSALAAQNQIVINQGNGFSALIGGGSSYNAATGAVTGGFTVNGTTYVDVAAAVGNVATAVDNVAATAANAVQYDDAGHSNVTLGGTGAAAPVGLHNVAAGAVNATSTDAVNGAQLNATNQQVAQNGNDISSLSASITNGTVGLVQQTGGAPGAGAITVGALTGGTSIDISGTDGNRVMSGVAAGVAATDAVNVGQLAAAITGISLNAVTYDDAARSGVTFNAGGAAVALHNVASGDVGATSTDGVNGSQLYATNQQVTTNTTQIAAINNGEAGAFRSNNSSARPAPSAGGADAVAGGFGAVASGAQSVALGSGASATGRNSVALGYGSLDGGLENVVSVGYVGGERQITNVAAGARATDAVNLGQMNSGLADTLTAANAYTDSRLAGMNFDLGQLRRDADAGTAAAMAVAGLPQAFTPGAGMIAGGIGVWRDETAVALGLSKAFRDGHTVVKGGATMTTRSNTFGANIAIGYQF